MLGRLRTPADVALIEQLPLDQRITRWDFALNLLDGCRHDPARPALLATDNGDLDGPLVSLTFAELQQRAMQNTGGSGLRIVSTLHGAATAAQQQAEEILSAFSVPFSIASQ